MRVANPNPRTAACQFSLERQGNIYGR
jgi:hypothetical protein